MNICNKINENLAIEEKYEQVDLSPLKGSEGPDGEIKAFTYTLKNGDIELSVFDGGDDYRAEVYAISIGDKEIFDAVESDGAMSIPDAKRYVERYRNSRKFNPEKWLQGKYVDKLLKDIDAGKFKKPIEQANSKNVVNILLTRLIEEIEDYGFYVDTGIVPFANDIVAAFLRTNKAKKIMFSKVRRLVTKGSGVFASKFTKGEFEGFSDDKSSKDILDRAINRLTNSNGSSEFDFFGDFEKRSDLLDKIKKVRK